MADARVSRYRTQRAVTEADRKIGKHRTRRVLSTEVTVQGRNRRWPADAPTGGTSTRHAADAGSLTFG
jgi:hypothetical protein